jgi:Domain of unknown function (DUF4159)
VKPGRLPSAAWWVAVACLIGVELAAGLEPGQAQERRGGFGRGDRYASLPPEAVDYDGRFVFVRLRFSAGLRDGFGRGEAMWAHDFPKAERNFMKILDEITTIGPYMDGLVLDIDDPRLFKYPVAYLVEPGFLTMTDAEATNLREYLLKGGCLIVDDFAEAQWYNFEAQVRRMLPDARFFELDQSHPVFDSFFHIESLDYYHPYRGLQARFIGVFEDNDPDKSPIMLINYNNDIGEYWEWSDTGWVPIDITNDAYKLGVNYVVYAMTH